MEKHLIIEKFFDNLIDKMKQQVQDPSLQSFGSLDYHLNLAIEARAKKEYLNPLYYVHLPRWMGEYGNTRLEDEILMIAHTIDSYVIDLYGGKEKVNRIREQYNKEQGY